MWRKGAGYGNRWRTAFNRSLVCVCSASSGGVGMVQQGGLSFGMFSDKRMRTSSGQSHAYRSRGPRTSPITALETSGRRWTGRSTPRRARCWHVQWDVDSLGSVISVAGEWMTCSRKCESAGWRDFITPLQQRRVRNRAAVLTLFYK